MNAKNPKFAIAPKGTYNSVVSGVKYPIVSYTDSWFEIRDIFTGDLMTCLQKGCAHLDGKNWILRNK